MLVKAGTRKDYVRKELKFQHEGKEYVVVIQCTNRKLKEAENNATFSCGAKLNSCELFDMTTYRKSNK